MDSRDKAQSGVEDCRPLQWLAMYSATHSVQAVRDTDLARPTPCAGWTVRDLLRHMVGHNRGFAAELEGRTPDPVIWNGLDLGLDPRPHWGESARRVVAAFTARTSLTEKIQIAGFGTVTVAQGARMHAIDYLVHAWDVSVAIGQAADLDEGACRRVLKIAESWPTGHPDIWGPGAPFGQPVVVDDDAPPSHRMLGLLGRAPGWPQVP
ncbi:MAG TPA: TIGR03086 family metal-binding protein [Nocardioidaceae bacterium]|nr:TIGR03086 family metal-binding protein [Nocardioidaceae bacterium]